MSQNVILHVVSDGRRNGAVVDRHDTAATRTAAILGAGVLIEGEIPQRNAVRPVPGRANQQVFCIPRKVSRKVRTYRSGALGEPNALRGISSLDLGLRGYVSGVAVERCSGNIARSGAGENRFRICRIVPVVLVGQDLHAGKARVVEGGAKMVCDEVGCVGGWKTLTRIARGGKKRLVVHRA